MANADVAWVDVLPSMANFLPQLTRGVDQVVPGAGTRAGRQFGEAFGASSASSVESASAKMNLALKKVADTAGQVRVAEAKLEELRNSEKATASQLVAAEERVASARRNETEANSRLSTATSGMQAAQRRATEETRAGTSAVGEHETRTRSLTGAMGGMKNAVIAGFGAFVAAKEAGEFMGEVIHDAANMQAQIHRTNVVFGEGSEAIQKWAENAATRIGMSAQEALAGAGKFGTLFTTMGIGREQATTMSEKMVTLAADMGAFAHTSPGAAMDALNRAMAGGTRGLRQYGIVLDQNMIKQKAQEMGLYSGKGALDVNAKAQATYALVLEHSTRVQGDFTRQGGNVAVQQKVLSAEWANAKESLGQLVVGPALGFIGFLTKALPLLEKAVHWIQENKAWLGPLAIAIAGIVVAWKAWNEAVELWKIITESSPIIRIITVIIALGVALVAAYKHSQTFRDIVNGVFHVIGATASWLWNNILKPAWAGLKTAWEVLSAAIRFGWERIIKPAWDIMVGTVRTIGVIFHAIWTGISAAWSGLVTGIKFAWDNILHPVFTVIGDVVKVMAHILIFVVLAPIVLAWKALVAVFKFLWDSVLHPVFDAIVAVATFWWEHVLKPIFEAYIAAWRAVGAAFEWVYQNVILVVWHAVQTAAQWLWTNVLKPIFDAIVAGWHALGTALDWVYQNVILRVWHAIQATADWLWNTILKPIFDAIGTAWHALGTGLQWVYDHVIHPIWQGFVDAIHWVRDTFNDAVTAIGHIWEGIEHALLTPVQWVIDIVWNNGLRKLWNDINNIWGGNDLQPFKLPGFASGGVVGAGPNGRMVQAEDGSWVNSSSFYGAATGAVLPGWTPGRDVHYFFSPTAGGLALSGGEAIMRPEFTAAVGPGWVDGMNARARAGGIAGVRDAMGFASGGIVSLGSRALDFMTGNPVGRFLSSIIGAGVPFGQQLIDYVSKERGLTGNGGGTPIFSMLGDMIRNGANEIWTTIRNAVTSWLAPGGGGYANYQGAMAQRAAAAAQINVGNLANANFSALGTAGVVQAVLQVANQYGWGSGAEWNALSRIISMESGWRPTAQNPTSTAYGLFQFLNSTWTAGKTSDPTSQAMQGLAYIRSRYGDPLSALSFHLAHGWYDNGGLLPHGWTGLNTSGADERIFSPPQDDYFKRFVDATSSQMQPSKRMLAEKIEVHAPSQHQGEQIIDQLWHRLQVADFGGVYTFAGSD